MYWYLSLNQVRSGYTLSFGYTMSLLTYFILLKPKLPFSFGLHKLLGEPITVDLDCFTHACIECLYRMFQVFSYS